ncbi:hypothetical protein ACFYOT_40735 [Saccharothrix saharensis]
MSPETSSAGNRWLRRGWVVVARFPAERCTRGAAATPPVRTVTTARGGSP